jgi:hypothetical protein
MKHSISSNPVARAGFGFAVFLPLIALSVSPARAQDSVLYPEAYYRNQRCLPPCACALGPIEGRLFGTYTLRLVSIGDVFDFYAIDNASFVVLTGTGTLSLSGSGTYQRSDFVDEQMMHLELTRGGSLTTIVLDSGFVPIALPLPAIRTSLVNTTTPCEHFALRFVGGPAVHCHVDFDNGQGLGIPDDAVDVSDLVYFLSKFETGDVAVDLDGGPCGCADCFCPNGAVDIQDMLFFLRHFELGC